MTAGRSKLRRALAILAICGIGGMTLALLTAAVWPRRYVSVAIVRFRFAQKISNGDARSLAQWKERSFSEDFVRGLTKRFALYSGESIDQRIENARRDIVLNKIEVLTNMDHELYRNTCCYEVGFAYGDPAIARLVADDVAFELVDAGIDGHSALSMLDPPRAAERRVPNMRLFTLGGLASGLFLASAFLWRRA